MPTEQISRYFQVASSDAVVAVEVDQRRAGQRRRLDADPEQAEVLADSVTSVIVARKSSRQAVNTRLGARR